MDYGVTIVIILLALTGIGVVIRAINQTTQIVKEATEEMNTYETLDYIEETGTVEVLAIDSKSVETTSLELEPVESLEGSEDAGFGVIFGIVISVILAIFILSKVLKWYVVFRFNYVPRKLRPYSGTAKLLKTMSKSVENSEYPNITTLSKMYQDGMDSKDTQELSSLDTEFFHELSLLREVKNHKKLLSKGKGSAIQSVVDEDLGIKMAKLKEEKLSKLYEEIDIYSQLRSEYLPKIDLSKSVK